MAQWRLVGKSGCFADVLLCFGRICCVEEVQWTGGAVQLQCSGSGITLTQGISIVKTVRTTSVQAHMQ